MSWTTRTLVLALFFLRWFQAYPLLAQSPVPIQAELVQSLNASKVKIGDSILAKLSSPWRSSVCDLRAGAIIQGHVVTQKAYSKTAKASEIGIIFDSGQCSGVEMKPLLLTVEAVIAPNASGPSDTSNSEEIQQLSSSIGLGLNGTMHRVSQAPTVYVERRHAKATQVVALGQVLGIPHLAISVGQGPDGASILRSAGRNVELSSRTKFVLLPSPRSTQDMSTDAQSTNSNSASWSSTITSVPPSTVNDENDFCVAPDCTIARGAGQVDERSQGAQMIFPLGGLGYLPPSVDGEMSSFDYDAGVAYLGPRQLLFTFNLHTLIHRSAADVNSSHRLRIIRGVLIDLEEKKVARIIDWRVPGSGRYLWPIGKDRVLIHVGQELRIYQPGLQLSDKISLEGPLEFVQASPDSEFFAMGTIHERHSREIHRQLAENDVREPEEDIEIRLLDSRFKLLKTIMRSSRLPPPVLLNEGELQIHSIDRNRWQFEVNTWSGERRVLTVANSNCTPLAQSMPGNLLFVLGCGGYFQWYQVFHGDGKAVLKGKSFSTDLGQTAGGNVGRNAFAIRIAQSKVSRVSLSVFKPSDLKSSQVAIYRTTDGRRLFSVTMSDPVPTVQTFAISPLEDQLALLKTSEIGFYRISVPAPAH